MLVEDFRSLIMARMRRGRRGIQSNLCLDGARRNCALPVRVQNHCPVLDNNPAPMGPESFPLAGMQSGGRLLGQFQSPILHWANLCLANATGASRTKQLIPQEFSGVTEVKLITPINALRIFWCKRSCNFPCGDKTGWCNFPGNYAY